MDEENNFKNYDDFIAEITTDNINDYEHLDDTFKIQTEIPKNESKKDFSVEKNLHEKETNSKNENKELLFDTKCSLEIVETVPVALRKGGYAKKMVVEHKTIYNVRFLKYRMRMLYCPPSPKKCLPLKMTQKDIS